MKLKAEVTIDADRATVWKYFDDADNIPRWQPTLKSLLQISGTPGWPDAVREFHYEEKGRTRVVRETITARREPDFLAGTTESATSNSVIVNHFDDAGEGKTRWVAYWNLAFKGKARFTSLFTHKSIQRRIDEQMNRFKLLVETTEAKS